MNKDVKKKSPFQKAWDEANQLVYVAQYEADMNGLPCPPAEEIVCNYFQLREELSNENDVYHEALSQELAKLKSEESE